MERGDIAALLWLLVSVIVILGLAYWVTKRLAGGSMFGNSGTAGMQCKLEPLARLPLGKGQSLLVVRTGSRCFLLGVAQSSISLLAEFTQEELESWTKESADRQGGTGNDFLRILHDKMTNHSERR